jgi:hydroxymethylglutaryl-CoA lyase
MSIKIVEVGPRDGFQMEKVFIPTDLKIKIINAISRTGVRKIEATSFVNPKVIPQMADAAEVMRGIDRVPGVIYTALVPNLKGAQRAVDAGVGSVRFVQCATETYNQRNIGQSIAQSLEECGRIIKFLESSGIPGEIIIGLSYGCPLEGPVEPRQVESLVRALFEMGYREFAIAD